MQKRFIKKVTGLFLTMAVLSAIFSGCQQKAKQEISSSLKSAASSFPGASEQDTSSSAVSLAQQSAASDLEVRFGDEGEPFLLHLEDNPTAAAIARHVGTSDWRLPIYHFDDYDNWEVMQYYDIPSRYETPSDPVAVTSEKGGEVYYSEPNRIVLFFRDAEVSGEYTKVGSFDYTDDFVSAVENNPVLEGWGNKIVLISPID